MCARTPLAGAKDDGVRSLERFFSPRLLQTLAGQDAQVDQFNLLDVSVQSSRRQRSNIKKKKTHSKISLPTFSN